MANSNNVNIRVVEELKNEILGLKASFAKYAPQIPTYTGKVSAEPFTLADKGVSKLEERINELIKQLKDSAKKQEDSTAGIANFTRALTFGGTGIAQTLSSLGRGDLLGAASGALNLGTGIGGALSSGGLGGAAIAGTMIAAIPLALMGMGASRISGNFQQGFQNQQQVFQLYNMLGKGMPKIGGGEGAFGGEAFKQIATQGFVTPGQAAGIGTSFLTGGGSQSQVNEGIKLFLQAQKNFGMSATDLAKTIGELSHWGSKDNITDIFKDAGKAAFGVGAQGFFSSGEWQKSQAMVSRVLTSAGGEAGNISRAGYNEMNRLFQMGNAFGLTPSMTGQAAAGVLQGLPSAFGNPAALAFLSANIGLSPFEMAFPNAEGTLGKITKWAGGGAQGSGFQNPTQMLLALQQTPLAPMSNLLSKMAFPEKFGKEGETIKNMSDAEFSKALSATMEGDKERQEQIAQNTKNMSDSMSEQGRVIVNLLTRMEGALQIATVGLVKQTMNLFSGDRGMLRQLFENDVKVESIKSAGFSQKDIKAAQFENDWKKKFGEYPHRNTILGERSFSTDELISMKEQRDARSKWRESSDAGEKMHSNYFEKNKSEFSIQLTLNQDGSQISNTVVKGNSSKAVTGPITIGVQ